MEPQSSIYICVALLCQDAGRHLQDSVRLVRPHLPSCHVSPSRYRLLTSSLISCINVFPRCAYINVLPRCDYINIFPRFQSAVSPMERPKQAKPEAGTCIMLLVFLSRFLTRSQFLLMPSTEPRFVRDSKTRT